MTANRLTVFVLYRTMLSDAVCVKITFLLCRKDMILFILQHSCCTLVCPFVMICVSLDHSLTVDKHWAKGMIFRTAVCSTNYVHHSGVQSYEQFCRKIWADCVSWV